MFTFHWSELLTIIVVGLLLLLGLALLMLRRRNEMLQSFLTPESPDIEREFFRVHDQQQDQISPEETVTEPEVQETASAATVNSEETARWGTPEEPAS